MVPTSFGGRGRLVAMPEQFVLGVDLDGVVADHTRRFREIVAERRGVDPESMPMERSWDFREWGFAPDEYDRLHRLAVTEYDMIRTMPVIEGAADALWRLSDAGIWLRIITHRLYVNWAHERAVGDTAAWLDEHRIPYRDLCFLGAKPEVQADAYIDDAPHNVTALRDLGNTVIVFDQPYNRHLVDGPRAANWEEAESIVADLAAGSLGHVAVQLPGIDAGSRRLHDRRRAE
jgi:5'(3')-deoxyribonucleotidase